MKEFELKLSKEAASEKGIKQNIVSEKKKHKELLQVYLFFKIFSSAVL